MPANNHLALSILEAIEEPALIIDGGRVAAANVAARQMLGNEMVGRDLRFAIRHPRALEIISAGREKSVEVIGPLIETEAEAVHRDAWQPTV